MKLITKIEVYQADHTEVIDQAATQVGQLASKAALAIFNRTAQDAQKIIGYGGQARGIVDARVLEYRKTQVKPAWEEVKGSAIALYQHGCKKGTAFFQGLIKSQITDRLDAHWELHNKVLKWFKAKVDEVLADKPAKDKTEELAPTIPKKPEQSPPIAALEEPITEVAETVQVLDPPVDDDSLEDEMAIPEDPAPVPATAKRRATRKSSIAALIKEEVGKS